MEEKYGKNYYAIIFIIKNNDNYKNIENTVKKIIKKISNISNNGEVTKMYINNLIDLYPYNNFYIKYELSNYYLGEVRCLENDFREYIEELNINFIMLDMYIRKNLIIEYPELFSKKISYFIY